jgi:hypothetical protein
LLRGAVAGALRGPVAAFPATDPEIAELEVMIDQMKVSYEQRIRSLQKRLAPTERAAARSAVSNPLELASLRSQSTGEPLALRKTPTPTP